MVVPLAESSFTTKPDLHPTPQPLVLPPPIPIEENSEEDLTSSNSAQYGGLFVL